MNTQEQTKIEIRFYKRFFDEMELAISLPTTYAKLKIIASRYGIPLSVLDLLVLTGLICGIDNDQEHVFEPRTGKDQLVYYFFFTDEPDYKMADDLRIVIHQQIENHEYDRSGMQKNLIEQLEAEDDLRFRVGTFLKGEKEEIKSEEKSEIEKTKDKHKVIEIKIPAWLEKFVMEILN